MNFFMYSKCGEGAGLLKRIQDEENDCSICIVEKEYSSVYNGILKKKSYPETNDVVIFDSSGMGQKADRLRDLGFKVFGASKFHDKLECDREFGLSFMENHNISIPMTQVFTEFKDGIEFIKSNPKERYVFKPSGKDVPTNLTYVGSDAEDLIIFMNFVERYFSNDIDDFVLQEFIEGSIISSEYWVGKNGFISPINHTVEVKKFMNDDIGPSTGCSGNLVWQGDDGSVMAELLRGIEKDLISEGFIGPIDINCIVNDKGIFGLEWTPRFGLDAMPSLLTLLETEVGKLISDSVNGQDSEVEFYARFSGGVRLTIPPYPIEPSSLKALYKAAPNEGIPIRDIERDDCDTYYYEVKQEGDLLVHSAGTGVIACISSIAEEDCKDCFIGPLEILEDCKVPDKQYRTDLGSILPQMYEEVMEVLDAVWTA